MKGEGEERGDDVEVLKMMEGMKGKKWMCVHGDVY